MERGLRMFKGPYAGCISVSTCFGYGFLQHLDGLHLLCIRSLPVITFRVPSCCRSFSAKPKKCRHFLPQSALSGSKISGFLSLADDPMICALIGPNQQVSSIYFSRFFEVFILAASAAPFLSSPCSGSLLCPVAMSFWTCRSCTYVNQGSSNKCDMCEQTKRLSSSSAQVGAPFPSSSSSMLSEVSKWGCRACTFLNKDTYNQCDICGTPRSSISLDSFAEIDPDLDDDNEDEVNRGTKFWPLRSCAGSISASQESSHKQTEASSLSTSIIPSATKERVHLGERKRKHQDDDEAMPIKESESGPSSSASNSLLRNLHFEKMQRNNQSHLSDNQGSLSPSRNSLVRTVASDSSSIVDDKQSIAILTYNIWFREDLEVVARMDAIGAIISENSPHFICFQEVTPRIYDLFQHSSWWGRYKCSVPPAMAGKRAYFCLMLSRVDNVSFHRKAYNNSVMGRELCIAQAVGGGGRQLLIATTHLESPCPAPPTWDQMFSMERVSQANQALNALKGYQNVVFGGDMNWDDKLDGSPPLPASWCDAWNTLRPNEDGLTYDSKQNPLLTGSRLRKRLDRIFCHLQDFRLESIEMVGTKPIPGVMFEKEVKSKKQSQKLMLPVLPSDHFGLLLKII